MNLDPDVIYKGVAVALMTAYGIEMGVSWLMRVERAADPGGGRD